MARQHFYSRVPFRVSMFNRADGFDTFACSEGVEREFIDKDLSVVCENKPTPNESVQIRKGELPPVYCMFTAKDGTLVESCTTYLPLDYTGERSSYMVHNLLFSPQEAESLFFTPKRIPFNADMFEHEIDHFNITSPTAKPFFKYPEKDYVCLDFEPTDWLLDEFDSIMLSRLLYCILAASCGSLKNLYLYFPDHSSEFAIRFFNTIYSVFPYHMRPQLSFATRVSDISRYSSIKIKCLSANVVVPPVRGAMINLKVNQYTGMRDDDIAPWRQIIDLFISMLKNDAIRQEFLVFAQNAVKSVPALAQPSLKMLNNLVFLFRCSSGLFEERLVLPTDDKILEYFTVYEKYRAALSPEFRTNAVKCIKRYPATHTAIPQKLFAKIAKIYPTDIPAVRYIIMQVVLDLIHMDIMRDKLFAFVRSNYASQERDEKDEIIKNISRVFYGGFLQSQILSFFQSIFLDESPDAQLEIMDKLLLSIRNKDVKDQIMTFIETNFKGFTPQIRHNIYLAAIEHIQEGDDLASRLIDVIDLNMPGEVPEERTWFELKLVSAAKAEQRKKNHPMIRILAQKHGYCSALVLKKVFNEEMGKKAYGEVIAGFCEGTLKDLALSLRQALPLFSDFDEEANARLYRNIKESLDAQQKRYDLPSVIEADKIITKAFEEEEEPLAVLFWQDFAEQIIASAMKNALPDVFRYINQPEVLDEALEVSKKYSDVTESEGYAAAAGYKRLLNAIDSCSPDGILKALDEMPGDQMKRRQMSEYMRRTYKVKDEAPVRIKAWFGSVITYLKSGEYDFTGMYDTAKQILDENEEPQEETKGRKGAAGPDTGLEAIGYVLEFGNAVGQRCGQDMKDALYAEGSSLSGALNSYIGLGKNQEKKKLSAAIGALKPENSEFAVKCTEYIKGSAKPSFFSSLFGRK